MYNQKMAIFRLLAILEKETDCDRRIPTNELLYKLKSEYDVSLDRKTLYEYAEILKEAGFEVEWDRGRSNVYYIKRRHFELAELKILIDAVIASKFLSPGRTDMLVEKLASFAGPKKSMLRQRNVMLTDTKHGSDDTFYIVDAVFSAVSNNHKLSFYYYDITDENRRRLHREERYLVSPLMLIYDHDNYYLAACDEKENIVKYFRVDRMGDAKEEDEPRIECRGKDLNAIKKQTFSMFGGSVETVEFRIDKSCEKIAADQFGKNIVFTDIGDGKSAFKANVQISPTFFSWCSALGKNLRILSPDCVREKYKAFLLEALSENG
jgi:predicted DNA-binding transcriptional regulator YafY